MDILDTTHGPPLGTSHHDHPYTHSERALEPGDLVVFYTDGLIELRNEDIATSADRLAAALSSINPGAENQAEHLYQAMRPTGLHSDDVAIVAINFAI